jgi:type II secretory pathway component PulF
MRNSLTPQLLADVISTLYVPILLIVGAIGLLGYMDSHVVPQMIDILPFEKWPLIPRVLYQLIH